MSRTPTEPGPAPGLPSTDAPDVDADVAVVGAGPVGATLALLLARRGRRVALIDRKDGIDPRSRAIAIWPRSLEILEAAGALEPMVRRGQVTPRLRFRRSDTRATILEMDFADLDPICATPFALALPQDRTERVLLERAEAEPTIDVRLGTEFLDAEQDGAGVRLRTSAGELRARYLVGCDGASSRVRRGLGVELEGKTYPGRAFLADVRVRAEADSDDGWLVLQPSDRFVACIRHAERTWRVIDQSFARGGDESAEALDAHARDLGAQVWGDGAVEAILWSSAYDKHERQAPTVRAGRVLLAGDAAHLNSPAGGQGMNTGLRDAYNLAWKLDLALDEAGDAERLLESYATEQSDSFAEDVAPLTDRIEKGQTAPAWVRRALLRHPKVLDALGLGRAAMESHSMLFIDYGRSPLLAEDHPLAGRRMPNVMLPSGRLYREAGRLGLLLDRDGDGATRAAGERLGLPVARLPRALDELGFSGVEQILMRPDGIVARASAGAIPDAELRAALGLRAGARTAPRPVEAA